MRHFLHLHHLAKACDSYLFFSFVTLLITLITHWFKVCYISGVQTFLDLGQNVWLKCLQGACIFKFPNIIQTHCHIITKTRNTLRCIKSCTDLSHTRTVQAAMIHREMLKTSSTVPGQMVMRVFITNLVLKWTWNKNTHWVPWSW